jgi:transposase
MGKARSEDLRARVVAEVAAGSSRRQAAERFKVSPASAVRWVRLQGQTGSIAPRPRGGKSRSPSEPASLAGILAIAHGKAPPAGPGGAVARAMPNAGIPRPT